MSDFRYSEFVGKYCKIYTLSDANGDVFYVGCTTLSVNTRLNQHIAEAKSLKYKGNIAKADKIKELNFQVTAKVIEVKWITSYNTYTLLAKLIKIEKEYIEKYTNQGFNLCNSGKKAKKEPVIEYAGQEFKSNINISL